MAILCLLPGTQKQLRDDWLFCSGKKKRCNVIVQVLHKYKNEGSA